MPNPTNNSKPTKKAWSKPDLIIISRADDVNGGARPSVHEANFTPNHTHYAPNGAGPFPATVFNNYVS